jgi:hypothetical protein
MQRLRVREEYELSREARSNVPIFRPWVKLRTAGVERSGRAKDGLNSWRGARSAPSTERTGRFVLQRVTFWHRVPRTERTEPLIDSCLMWVREERRTTHYTEKEFWSADRRGDDLTAPAVPTLQLICVNLCNPRPSTESDVGGRVWFPSDCYFKSVNVFVTTKSPARRR